MRFIRYLSVQVLAYGLDMGGFLLAFSYLGVGPIFSNVFAKVVAGVFAFLAHRTFTFGLATEDKHHGQAVKYFLLLAFNLPLSAAALASVMLLVSPPVLAKFIADVICVSLTYWLSKRYVFTRQSMDPGDSLTGPRSV